MLARMIRIVAAILLLSASARADDVDRRIIAAALADDGAVKKLAWLCDRIGARFSGSPALDQAVAWAAATLAADGHENVHTEPVMIPHWVRGVAEADVVTPVARPLHLLALSPTPPTPDGGLTAPLVVVNDFDELEKLGAAGVRGKIVLFDHPMAPGGRGGESYNAAVKYRNHGPGRASKLGAAAVLVRSVTAHSLGSPHTGTTLWETAKGEHPIPAAALTVEDTGLLHRLVDAGPVIVHLSLPGQQLPDAASANVVAELRGREKPEEIVLLSAHLDSWDVGQGAHDDGAGVVMAMEALTVLRRLGLRPRRTIRVVLFTNEENGIGGGKAYTVAHAAELPRIVAAIENDSGAFPAAGWALEVDEKVRAAALARANQLAARCAGTGPTTVRATDAGTDIEELKAGIPLLELDTDQSTYFDYHHSAADTFDKVDPAVLVRDVAATAVMAYELAEMPDTLPR